jgi:signal transduction histidine kinase
MVLAAVVDISVRKRLELELRQANAHLEEFTYVASHDLKSPLRGIGDLIEWLAEDLADIDMPQVARNLDRVRVRVTRMEGIISDLLAYARAGRSSTVLSPVSPRELVEAVLEVEVAPPGFAITVDCSAEAFPAARVPLETVLRNLVANAIKHHDRPDGRIAITARADDSFCHFSVADDGPGIPAHSRDRVFKLFQTVSTFERRGSGIGLAIAKRLVEGHGGRIVLEPSPERGVTFHVWWPRFPRRDHDE